MINDAMFVRQDDLNKFTLKLSRLCIKKGEQLVELRNGSFMKVVFKDITDGDNDSPLFHTADWSYCWNADGSSVKNDDLDIVATS